MMKERTRAETETVLTSVIQFYQTYVDAGLSKEDAIKQTLQSYDDFDQWMYFKGDFDRDDSLMEW